MNHAYEVREPQAPNTQDGGAQYAYHIDMPQKPHELVEYNYEVQIPIAHQKEDYLQRLATHIVHPEMPNQGCTCSNACTCNQYRSAMQTYPEQQFDSDESNAEVLKFNVNNVSDRIKRSPVENAFGATLSDLGDRWNDKFLELHAKKDELINKIKEKRSNLPKLDLSPWTDRANKARQEFVSNVNANFQGLNRNKRDANAEAKQQVRKETFYCPSCESLKYSEKIRHMPEVLQFLPEVEQKPLGRRKRQHCVGYGSPPVMQAPYYESQGNNNYHSVQPQYFEYINGQAVPYIPGVRHYPPIYQPSPEYYDGENRYVFDRFGHKYLENNGNLRLIIPPNQFERQPSQPNYPALNRIVSVNREFLDLTNYHAPGRMMAEPIDALRDGIRFGQEIFHNPNPILSNTNGHSAESGEEVGATLRNMREIQDVLPKQNTQIVMPITTNSNDESLEFKVNPKRSYPNENNKYKELGQTNIANDIPNMSRTGANAWNEPNNAEISHVGSSEVRQEEMALDNASIGSKNNVIEHETVDIKTDSQPSQMGEPITSKTAATADLSNEIYNIINFIYDTNDEFIKHGSKGKSVDNAQSKSDGFNDKISQ